MSSTKSVVIYHKADFDGLFSREIAKRALGTTDVEYIGWDYGDPLPAIAPDVVEIYMIDISVDGMMHDPRLIWIDHHKSAIEKFAWPIKGYRIDGVAACRLAWQWFFTCNSARNPLANSDWTLPTKEDFVDREVWEPIAVRLAGEYDVFDHRNPNALIFQHGLRAQELTDEIWNQLLDTSKNPFDGVPESGPLINQILERGTSIHFAKTKENDGIAKQFGFTIQFEGLTFLAINAARYNSFLFTAGLKPEHDGCFGFNWDGKMWRVSLYGVPGKPDLDFSKIAQKYGGGGHKQACGFKTEKLPFLP